MTKIAIFGNLVDSVTNISNYLENKGFKTVWAYNADDAYEICENQKVDLVLSDVKLEGGDEFTLVGKYPKIKFVFMGADEDQLLVAGKLRWVVGTLKKPIDLEKLVKIIKTKI